MLIIIISLTLLSLMEADYFRWEEHDILHLKEHCQHWQQYEWKLCSLTLLLSLCLGLHGQKIAHMYVLWSLFLLAPSYLFWITVGMFRCNTHRDCVTMATWSPWPPIGPFSSVWREIAYEDRIKCPVATGTWNDVHGALCCVLQRYHSHDHRQPSCETRLWSALNTQADRHFSEAECKESPLIINGIYCVLYKPDTDTVSVLSAWSTN